MAVVDPLVLLLLLEDDDDDGVGVGAGEPLLAVDISVVAADIMKSSGRGAGLSFL
jgi:hypothetical protein